MIDILSKLIKDKSVLILGFGKEGRSTYKMLQQIGLYKSVGIADANKPSDYKELQAVLHCGEGYLDSIRKYDVVFKSPGLVLSQPYESYDCTITSQTHLNNLVHYRHREPAAPLF